MQRHRISCAKLPGGHLKFECSVLYSNVDFYFKFDEYSKFRFFLTALLRITSIINQYVEHRSVCLLVSLSRINAKSQSVFLCVDTMEHMFTILLYYKQTLELRKSILNFDCSFHTPFSFQSETNQDLTNFGFKFWIQFMMTEYRNLISNYGSVKTINKSAVNEIRK